MSGFPTNQWYVAARSDEVAGAPFGRMICGEPIALFRRRDGSIAALEDRCPHRKYALSKGAVIGDEIQCGYHGLQFDGTGACTRIPSQTTIPRGFGTGAYAVVEKHALIFVWLGDAAKADPALLPDWSINAKPGWSAVHGYHYVKSNYQLLIDNLLDLTHLAIVHKTTLAGPGLMENPLEVETDGDAVRARRMMRNVDPTPLHRAVKGLSGKIDRSHLTEFFAPAYVGVWVWAAPVGSNDKDPHHVVLNSLTPETERSTHYFWSVARCFALDDQRITKILHDMNKIAFDEDQAILEEQQRMIDGDRSGAALASLDGDTAGAAARRIVAKKLAMGAQ
jgi:vanillate O-demethylase monooxygenase subunit